MRNCLFTILVVLCLIYDPCQAQEETAAPSLSVEVQLCTGITDRMPENSLESFSPDVGKVFLWCKVTGAETMTEISHVWYCRGEEKARVDLSLDGSPWRTWSSKTIHPSSTGEWEVKVLDAAGNVLATVPFMISPAE